jgi:LmbE family N-acetylglucosaminyl deacetylase
MHDKPPTPAQRPGTGVPRRLLGIWAHPDDEAYLSAGLMADVIDSGGSVTVLTLTDGEAGFPVDDPRPAAERAAQRRTELTAALGAVGVDQVRSLGAPDGLLDDQPSAQIVGPIIQAMLDVQPDVVVTFGPDGLTGHDDHVACWRFVTRAWRTIGVGDLWYAAKTNDWLEEWRELHDAFGVWMTEEPTGVDDAEISYTVDLAGSSLDRKRAALAGHASQTAGLSAAFGEDRFRRWIAQEVFRRPSEAHLEAAAAPTVRDLADWCHPRREVRS